MDEPFNAVAAMEDDDEPQMIAVASSNVASVGYSAKKRELYVEFLSGRTYTYTDVAPSEHAALMSAPSVGRALNQIIKPTHSYF